MSSRREQKERARAERLQREAELRARRRRKRQCVGLTATVTALASLGKLTPPGPPGPAGPEGVPVPGARALAGGEPAGAGSPVDGIQCQGAEQVLFHIHAHLTVFVDGAPRRIPYGIGIPGGQASPTPVGPVTAFYDGRRFRANPREIPLTRHAQIQLDVGRPLVAPDEISFPSGL